LPRKLYFKNKDKNSVFESGYSRKSRWIGCNRSGVQGFRVQGSGFRVQGSRFKVQGSRFKVQGSRFKVQGSTV
jgi:hypothetical protein